MTASSTSNACSFTKTDFSLNENKGVYQNGKAYGIQKRLEVAHTYLRLKDQAGENIVSMRQLAKETKVGRTFAIKIVNEIDANGVAGLQRPNKKKSFGVRIKALSCEDEVFLLNLRKNNARRSLQSYKNLLQIHCGTIVSKSTLHRWFHKRFPHFLS